MVGATGSSALDPVVVVEPRSQVEKGFEKQEGKMSDGIDGNTDRCIGRN